MAKLQKTDIPKLLMLIRVNFENAYNFKTEDEAKLLVEYWYKWLRDFPQELVQKAVENAICGSEFAPKIANILSEVYKLLNADKKTDEELWAELCDVRYGAYNAIMFCNPAYPKDTQKDGQKRLEKIWNELSPEIKAYVVNASSLAEIGKMDDDSLQFEKARFFKSMPRIRETMISRDLSKQFLKICGVKKIGLLFDGSDKNNGAKYEG